MAKRTLRSLHRFSINAFLEWYFERVWASEYFRMSFVGASSGDPRFRLYLFVFVFLAFICFCVFDFCLFLCFCNYPKE